MEYRIRDAADGDARAVTDVLNSFVEDSFAAYNATPVPAEFFTKIRQLAEGYPFYVVEAESGDVIGFAMLRRHHPADTFDRTAELTYFLLPEHTRRGLGTRLLTVLMERAVELGIDQVLASVSSLNEQSLQFHRKHGFVECGRFREVGRKLGRDFDVVWFQKSL